MKNIKGCLEEIPSFLLFLLPMLDIVVTYCSQTTTYIYLDTDVEIFNFSHKIPKIPGSRSKSKSLLQILKVINKFP